jgi:hypothetical protein
MPRTVRLAAIVAAGTAVISHRAFAHAVAGDCVFVNSVYGYFGKGFGDIPWSAIRPSPSLASLTTTFRTLGFRPGAIAEFHLYFDGLLPNTLGKPLTEW